MLDIDYYRAVSAILLLTDLEPDDILAIKLLAKIHANTKILVIVGNGKVNKCNFAHGIMQCYGFTNFTIVQGIHTDAEFPETAGLYDTDADLMEVEFSSDKLDKFLVKRPLIIAIKPMYELFSADLELLRKCNLVAYGGFNFRSIDNINLAQFINNSFNSVFIYESFFATNVNSVNHTNAPKLMQVIASDTNLIQFSNRWDALIVRDCIDTINTADTFNSETIDILCALSDVYTIDNAINRDALEAYIHAVETELSFVTAAPNCDRIKNQNLKPLQSILQGQQFVLADFALIACMFCKVKTKIDSGEIEFTEQKYTKMKLNAENRINLIKEVNFDELIDAIVSLLQ